MPPASTTAFPEAPPAAIPDAGTRVDGFSPGAIMGIVVAIIFLLLLVPLVAILLRRYESTRLRETPKSPQSSSGSLHSTREEPDPGTILVTKELVRSSVRMERVDSAVKRPDDVYVNERERGRGWSVTEVRGGDYK